MANDSMAIVVGASAEEFVHVEQCLADWQCASVSLNNEQTGVSSIPQGAKLVIVYARKVEKDTLGICEQFRNSPETSVVPILLVIGRYEIAQGHTVRRMGNAAFIIIPFDEKGLNEKIKELLK